jgi:glyoxylase-like metal-dependent hydrolase (beta-lactamase superfamily II)
LREDWEANLSDEAGIFSVRKLAPHLQVITELGCVHCYLVEGEDWALLIDSGLGRGNIRAAVEQLTDRPVVVVNTHAHRDHMGGNHHFDSIALHGAEADWLEREATGVDRIECTDGQFTADLPETQPWAVTHRLSHGETLDLGGVAVEVWHTPGHTPGSICLLEESSRFLFTGDTVYAGPLALQFDESDLPAFAETVKSLESIGWDTNLVLPGHGETPLDGGILLEVGSGVQRLLDGEGRYREMPWNGQLIFDVALGRFSIRSRRSYRSDQ